MHNKISFKKPHEMSVTTNKYWRYVHALCRPDTTWAEDSLDLYQSPLQRDTMIE